MCLCFQPREHQVAERPLLPAARAVLRSRQPGVVQLEPAQQPPAGQDAAAAAHGAGGPGAHAGGGVGKRALDLPPRISITQDYLNPCILADRCNDDFSV